jgi:putative endonuclease
MSAIQSEGDRLSVLVRNNAMYARIAKRDAARWSVYLLRCVDGSLYCGITTDLERRLRQHNAGTASKYTRSRRPVKVRAGVGGYTKSDALRLERAVKKLPAAAKAGALYDEGGCIQS